MGIKPRSFLGEPSTLPLDCSYSSTNLWVNDNYTKRLPSQQQQQQNNNIYYQEKPIGQRHFYKKTSFTTTTTKQQHLCLIRTDDSMTILQNDFLHNNNIYLQLEPMGRRQFYKTTSFTTTTTLTLKKNRRRTVNNKLRRRPVSGKCKFKS